MVFSMDSSVSDNDFLTFFFLLAFGVAGGETVDVSTAAVIVFCVIVVKLLAAVVMRRMCHRAMLVLLLSLPTR